MNNLSTLTNGNDIPKLESEFLFKFTPIDKFDTLVKAVKRMKKDNERLLQETKEHKRASTILGLHEEMEGQDYVIELLRELLRNENHLETVEIDQLIREKMSEGPRRVRPPSREELLIQLRLLQKKLASTKAEYYRLNPEKRKNFLKHKDIQVDMSQHQPEDAQTDFADESGFLSDFNLSQVDSSVGFGMNEMQRQADQKYRMEQKMDKLKFMIDQENQKIRALESLVQNKASSVNKILNIDGDIDLLRKNLEKERLIIKELDNKNNEVRKRVELYDGSLNKGVSSCSKINRSSFHILEDKGLQCKLLQLSRQSARLLTCRSAVRSRVEAHFFIFTILVFNSRIFNPFRWLNSKRKRTLQNLNLINCSPRTEGLRMRLTSLRERWVF